MSQKVTYSSTRSVEVPTLEAWLARSGVETPARDWMVDGLHLWPLLTTSLVSLAIQVRIRQRRRLLRTGGLGWKVAVAVDTRAVAPLRALARAPRMALPPDSLEGKILYHANAVHCRPLGPAWVTPPLDVPAILMRRAGYEGLYWFENVAVDEPWLAKTIAGPARGVSAVLEAATRRCGSVDQGARLDRLAGFQAWCADVARQLTFSPKFLRLWLARQVDHALAARGCYEEAFALRGRPRLIVMLNGGFASTVGLTAAARGSGIPVVEVQHGVDTECGVTAVRDGPPFSSFTSAPDAFIAWDLRRAGDEAVLHTGPLGLHLPAVLAEYRHDDGGMLRSTHDFVSQQGTLLESKAMSLGAKREVLVTMQPGDDGGWLEPLIGATAPDVLFWVRRHRGDLANKLRLSTRIGSATIETELATGAALPILLRRVRAHLTRFSSTAMEASALGIPTLAVEDYARDLFHFLPGDLLHVQSDFDLAARELAAMLAEDRRQQKKQLPDISATVPFLERAMQVN